ncbi:TPA: hypothetical protein ACOTG0_000941 [Clostridium perfringens]
MEKHSDFLKGLKEGKGIIILILDEWSFNKKELVSNVINHMEKEGKECVYVRNLASEPIVAIDGKEYSVKISNYGNNYSLIPSQNIILTPQ